MNELTEYANLCAKIHSSLYLFTKRSYPAYKASPFHYDLINQLEQFEKDVIAKKSPRLIINLPPRVGKSFLASERFPAWFIGRNPTKRIIGTSYAKELANDFSRHVRELIKEDWYKDVFPDTEVSEVSASVEKWETTSLGGYRAAGVGGGIVGFGAHVFLVDDPIKSPEQAFSQSYRDKVFTWFQSAANSRIEDGGGIIIIMQRWHEDDLTGRLLKEQPDKWKHIVYPMVDSKGNALDDNRFPIHICQALKEDVGEYFWASMYQQAPKSDSEMPFNEDAINRINQVNLQGQIVKATLDLAYATSDTNDYSAIVIGGIDAVGTKTIAFAEERRVNPVDRDEWLTSIIKSYESQGLKELHVEGTEDAILRIKELLKTFSKVTVHKLSHKGRPKKERILEIESRLPTTQFGPLTQQLINRLLSWSPDGKTPDDLPDALAYLFSVLDETPRKSQPWNPKGLSPTQQNILKAMKPKRPNPFE